jgi:hypothetical protein
MPGIVVLLLLLLAAGCAAEDDGSGGLTDTFSRMREAGYDWTSVQHRQRWEGVHEIIVEVRTSTEPVEQAATRAAKLVWTTHEGPLHHVTVVVNDDHTKELDRRELAAQFGPRDVNLDPPPPGDDSWMVVVWSIVIGLAGAFAVALIVVKLWRRAKS